MTNAVQPSSLSCDILTLTTPDPLLHPQVYLAPGDTFRAAAAEQLAEWARRSGAVMGPFKEGGKPGGLV